MKNRASAVGKTYFEITVSLVRVQLLAMETSVKVA